MLACPIVGAGQDIQTCINKLHETAILTGKCLSPSLRQTSLIVFYVGTNQWLCWACQTKRNAFRDCKIRNAPTLLCVSVKRFNSRRKGKLCKLVKDMTPLVVNEYDKNLCACVVVECSQVNDRTIFLAVSPEDEGDDDCVANYAYDLRAVVVCTLSLYTMIGLCNVAVYRRTRANPFEVVITSHTSAQLMGRGESTMTTLFMRCQYSIKQRPSRQKKGTCSCMNVEIDCILCNKYVHGFIYMHHL